MPLARDRAESKTDIMPTHLELTASVSVCTEGKLVKDSDSQAHPREPSLVDLQWGSGFCVSNKHTNKPETNSLMTALCKIFGQQLVL